jgi:hypothetical protein
LELANFRRTVLATQFVAATFLWSILVLEEKKYQYEKFELQLVHPVVSHESQILAEKDLVMTCGVLTFSPILVFQLIVLFLLEASYIIYLEYMI